MKGRYTSEMLCDEDHDCCDCEDTTISLDRNTTCDHHAVHMQSKNRRRKKTTTSTSGLLPVLAMSILSLSNVSATELFAGAHQKQPGNHAVALPFGGNEKGDQNAIVDQNHRRLPENVKPAASGMAPPGSNHDLFEFLDTKHDGVIDRDEFRAGTEKFISFFAEDLHKSGGYPHLLGVSEGAAAAKKFASDAVAAAKRKVHDLPHGIDEIVHPHHTIAALSPGDAAAAGGAGGNAYANADAAADDDTKFWPALVHSAAMIIATEIGDKTFFIAAVLSMRNSRLTVFLGALTALFVMTVLSTMMGLILPSFLPRQYTSTCGGLLFLYFGVRLLLDSRGMEHKVSEELEEVEEELAMDAKGGAKKAKTEDDVENGKSTSNGGMKRMASSSKLKTPSQQNIFMQSLTLTFLAEWGDRSQIATIALASHKDPYGVTVGGTMGHFLCTGMAVVGGRMLAAKISEKTVSFGGGIIFLLFGLHSLFFEE